MPSPPRIARGEDGLDGGGHHDVSVCIRIKTGLKFPLVGRPSESLGRPLSLGPAQAAEDRPARYRGRARGGSGAMSASANVALRLNHWSGPMIWPGSAPRSAAPPPRLEHHA